LKADTNGVFTCSGNGVAEAWEASKAGGGGCPLNLHLQFSINKRLRLELWQDVLPLVTRHLK
jgi:hypothetical protein